jgi:hypothetical protein
LFAACLLALPSLAAHAADKTPQPPFDSYFGYKIGQPEDSLVAELKKRGVKNFLVLSGEGAVGLKGVPSGMFCTVNMAPEGVPPKIAPLRKYTCPVAWIGAKGLMLAVFHTYRKALVEMEFIFSSSGGATGLTDAIKTFGPKYERDPAYARQDLLTHNRPDAATVCTKTPCHTLGWLNYKTAVAAGVLFTGEPSGGNALVLRIVDTMQYGRLTTELQQTLLKMGH